MAFDRVVGSVGAHVDSVLDAGKHAYLCFTFEANKSIKHFIPPDHYRNISLDCTYSVLEVVTYRDVYKCSVNTTHCEDRQLEHIAYSQLAVAVYTFFVTPVLHGCK